MIKADFIEESDLKKIKELKKFLAKNRMRLGGEETIVSFYGKGGHRWFYVGMNFAGNKWRVRKSMELTL
jgi:hypothetical protein